MISVLFDLLVLSEVPLKDLDPIPFSRSTWAIFGYIYSHSHDYFQGYYVNYNELLFKCLLHKCCCLRYELVTIELVLS